MKNKRRDCLLVLWLLTYISSLLASNGVTRSHSVHVIDQSWVDHHDKIFLPNGGTIVVKKGVEIRHPITITGHYIVVTSPQDQHLPSKITFKAKDPVPLPETRPGPEDHAWIHITPGSSNIVFENLSFYNSLDSVFRKEVFSMLQVSHITFRNLSFYGMNNLQALVAGSLLHGDFRFESIRVDRFSLYSPFHLSGFQAAFSFPNVYFDDIEFGSQLYCDGLSHLHNFNLNGCIYNFTNNLMTLENIGNFRLHGILINNTLVNGPAFNFPIHCTDQDWILERFAKLAAHGEFSHIHYDWSSNPQGMIYRFGSSQYRNMSMQFFDNNFYAQGSQKTDAPLSDEDESMEQLMLIPIKRCCGTSPPEIHPTPIFTLALTRAILLTIARYGSTTCFKPIPTQIPDK